MDDLSVGAVGAAIIAGLISILGLVIGKEQKVSEFRQAWINDLRNSLIAYLSNINAISDAIRIGSPPESYRSTYEALNTASFGIIFRVNHKERSAKKLLSVMQDFEKLASSNRDLTPENIRALETLYVRHSRKLLKLEWKRVKRGEDIYVWTTRIVITSTLAMIALFIGAAILMHEGAPPSKLRKPIDIHRTV